MTTVTLTGGDLGEEKMMIRCDLSQACSPVQVDYCNGDENGFESTQYQCADAKHTDGLIEIGKILAARAVEVPYENFSCDVESDD